MGKLVEAFNTLFPDEERDEYIEALAALKALEDEGTDPMVDEAAIRADERAKTEREMKIKFKKIILEPNKQDPEPVEGEDKDEEDITIEDLFEDKKEDED